MNAKQHAHVEPWLTRREVAEELRVSPSTVDRLGLPHLRVGNQNRYKMSEVERLLRERMSAAGQTNEREG